MAGTTPRRAGRPLLSQYWRDGLLPHWPVRARAVAGLMPPGAVPDVCDGTSRGGPVAFGMEHPGPDSGGGLPFFGTFPEVNVRLFSVDGHGRRGVVFRSLDCPRLATVPAARAALGLLRRWSDTRWTAEYGAPHLAGRLRGPAGGRTGRPLRGDVGPRLERPGLPATSSLRGGVCTPGRAAARCTCGPSTRAGRCTAPTRTGCARTWSAPPAWKSPDHRRACSSARGFR